MASRQSQIRNLLTNEFADLFDPDTLGAMKIKQDAKGEQIWVPQPLPIKDLKGVPLRDGVGYIRIQETFKLDRVVAYVYKFTSDEYIFTTERTGSSEVTDECRIFDFHYDGEENDSPHSPHISVVFPSLRYISRRINLEDFLVFIRDHFFELSVGKLVKKSNPIWTNRM